MCIRDSYTGIVFECFDRRGELRAICGGGRYDRLLSLYGSPKDEQTGDYKWTIPCVGFGFGDCVIMELLNDLKKVAAPKRNVDYLVAAYKPEMYGAATRVAAALRSSGASVDLYPLDKKPRWVFDYANKVGAARVAYIAPNEWSQGKVRFKDMTAEEGDEGEKQVDVPIDQLDNVDSFFGGAGGSSLGGEVAQELARAKARIAELTKRVEALE
jgi:histidyl-tRNA synthetase